VADRLRVGRIGAALAVTAALASGCGLFGDDDEANKTAVYDIEPGQCFLGPTKVKAQIEDLETVPCDKPHDREAYAVTPYEAPEGESADQFPGDEQLTTFAQGACAAEFERYVGVDYADSDYFFTYLLPSPRSWEDDDRDVICLVIGTGEPLTESVKGSKK
jgi:hypothetical protein